MVETTAESLISVFDSAPLNHRYWVTFGLLSIGASLDLFDFIAPIDILSAPAMGATL